jgi:hypothetical protein
VLKLSVWMDGRYGGAVGVASAGRRPRVYRLRLHGASTRQRHDERGHPAAADHGVNMKDVTSSLAD